MKASEFSVNYPNFMGRYMMQFTYSEIGRDVEDRIQNSSMPEAVSAASQMLQPTLSALDTLNYVYGAIAANSFIELESLR